MLLKATVLFLIVASSIASFGWAEFPNYETHGKRDPFVPLVGPEKPTVARPEDITSIDDVSLEGIVSGPKGTKAVMINGEILKEHDKVGDLEIKKITKRTVTLIISGKEYNKNLPEEGGIKNVQ